MHAYTKQECETWIKSGFGAAADWSLTRPSDRRSTAAVENWPARKQLALARRVALWLVGASPSPVLVWVKQVGVWPSSEHRALYETWHRAMGGSGRIDEAPGHLFDAGEIEHAVTLMLLAQLFGWGFVAAAQGAPRVAHCDHDGEFWLTSAGAPIASEAVLGTGH